MANEDLRWRLNQTRSKRIKGRKEELDIIRDEVIRALKNGDRYLKWTILKTGSYYEKLQINTGSNICDYDYMLVLEGRYQMISAERDVVSPDLFCSLKLVEKTPRMSREYLTCAGGEYYLCSKRIKMFVQRTIKDALLLKKPEASATEREKYVYRVLKGLKIEEPTVRGCGPAVTLTVKSGQQTYSIDFVPAIQLHEWPAVSMNWTSNWLSVDPINGKIQLKKCKQSVRRQSAPILTATEIRCVAPTSDRDQEPTGDKATTPERSACRTTGVSKSNEELCQSGDRPATATRGRKSVQAAEQQRHAAIKKSAKKSPVNEQGISSTADDRADAVESVSARGRKKKSISTTATGASNADHQFSSTMDRPPNQEVCKSSKSTSKPFKKQVSDTVETDVTLNKGEAIKSSKTDESSQYVSHSEKPVVEDGEKPIQRRRGRPPKKLQIADTSESVSVTANDKTATTADSEREIPLTEQLKRQPKPVGKATGKAKENSASKTDHGDSVSTENKPKSSGKSSQRVAESATTACEVGATSEAANTEPSSCDEEDLNDESGDVDATGTTAFPCVVAKIHPTEFDKEPNQCTLWRLSYSMAEKFAMRHANTRSAESCRKDVLRLLKEDYYIAKLRVKASKNGAVTGFCSYYLKSIVLSLSETGADWSPECLASRYVDALRATVECLEKKVIRSYFVPGANLMDLGEIGEDLNNAIKTLFRERIRHYEGLLPMPNEQ